MKVAIVGGGITGCLLAEFLKNNTSEVTIFEKSRGCGGRASTKRTDWGQCDLGATIVPAKSAGFEQFMQDLCEQQLATQWPSKIYAIEQKADIQSPMQVFRSERRYYIFNHKMNAVCQHWVQATKLYTNSLVTEIRHVAGQGWQVKIEDVWFNELFDKLVITAPWPQSRQLIENSVLPFTLPKYLQDWTSCWSVGIKVAPKIAEEVDLLYLKGLPVQTLIRDSAKPDRPKVDSTELGKPSEIWVAQLTNELSDGLTKVAKEQAIALANKTFCDLFELPKHNISHNFAHYWRFARPSAGQTPLGLIEQSNLGFYAGGDWSFGASIESAFEAAINLKNSVLSD